MAVAYDDEWDDALEDATSQYVVPTAEQLAALNRGALRTLVRSVAAQVVTGIAVALIAWAVAGVGAGVSALAGAAACAIPCVLFALRLLIGMARPGGANPATFFLGEFLKLASTGLLLWLVVEVGQDDLVWPALIAGLIVALKSHYWLLLFKDS